MGDNHVGRSVNPKSTWPLRYTRRNSGASSTLSPWNNSPRSAPSVDLGRVVLRHQSIATRRSLRRGDPRRAPQRHRDVRRRAVSVSAARPTKGILVTDDVDELGPVDDVANLAVALEPGSTARLLVYEDRWAAPFAAAARRAGGPLVARGRIRWSVRPVRAARCPTPSSPCPLDQPASVPK